MKEIKQFLGLWYSILKCFWEFFQLFYCSIKNKSSSKVRFKKQKKYRPKDLQYRNEVIALDIHLNAWILLRCECPGDYGGSDCQTHIECSSKSCGKNTECYVANHQINCVCKVGYSGGFSVVINRWITRKHFPYEFKVYFAHNDVAKCNNTLKRHYFLMFLIFATKIKFRSNREEKRQVFKDLRKRSMYFLFEIGISAYSMKLFSLLFLQCEALSASGHTSKYNGGRLTRSY